MYVFFFATTSLMNKDLYNIVVFVCTMKFCKHFCISFCGVNGFDDLTD